MMRFIPDLMSFSDGSSVRHIADWQKRRAEILKTLSEEEYGVTPPAPETVTGTVGRVNASCCAGHAVLEEITISFDTPNKPFSFPVHFFCPTAERKHPLFIFLNFRPDAHDRYIPVEEVVDNGFAVASVNYADVTSDDGDFTNGLAGRYPRTAPTAWGKIGMWAFAASRMIDYFVTRPEIDADLICVIGHSRLGKTALWCAAQDERVKYVFSNDSGCCGAAYEREKYA